MKEDAAGPGKLTTKNTKDTKDTKKKDAEKVEFTSISLFSGAGGLDIGLEQAGFETYDRKQRLASRRFVISSMQPASISPMSHYMI